MKAIWLSDLLLFKYGQMRTKHEPAPPPKFRVTPVGGHSTSMSNLMCTKIICKIDLQWNQVSNLEPSCPKAENSPGHRCPSSGMKGSRVKQLPNVIILLELFIASTAC
ncbi:hypothetical protein AVEN_24498-1 [Araneus ventricosus]|uniref:Uncharacterized protein n=1 Tax=Araneus ventricosus TaxID=182803 RepID=A0A4Y2L2H6_ARAVE|nr:hypothetical protein AVEN_24498-1 [Araneus ventricosus]